MRVPSLLSWDVAAPSTLLGGGTSSQERCRGACCWCGPSCGQSALGILTQAPPTTPGLSMRLLESRKGRSAFAFEHSEEYQQTQHRFLAAVESMEPNNMVVRGHPVGSWRRGASRAAGGGAGAFLGLVPSASSCLTGPAADQPLSRGLAPATQ